MAVLYIYWIVYLLHTNELSLRHLFQAINGVSSGPEDFSGNIENETYFCEKLPTISFKAISAANLSNDQINVLNISNSVIS